MNGIPRIKEVRSITQFGFSSVTIVFEGVRYLLGTRQRAADEGPRGHSPKGSAYPGMGPIATGLGEIYLFEVKNAPDAKKKRSLMDLRTVLDWDVARPLLSVPGVIEVNTFGGDLKTYQVQIDPKRLLARGISVTQVFEALQRNNSNAGGGYIERSGKFRVIRAGRIVGSLKDIEEIVLHTTPSGTPIYVRDVGEVVAAQMIPPGGGDTRRPGRGRHGHGPLAGRRERPGGRRSGQEQAG